MSRGASAWVSVMRCASGWSSSRGMSSANSRLSNSATRRGRLDSLCAMREKKKVERGKRNNGQEPGGFCFFFSPFSFLFSLPLYPTSYFDALEYLDLLPDLYLL